jgi:hypothetical protein
MDHLPLLDLLRSPRHRCKRLCTRWRPLSWFDGALTRKRLVTAVDADDQPLAERAGDGNRTRVLSLGS